MSTLSSFYSSYVRRYPGFALNLLAIVFVGWSVAHLTSECSSRVENKVHALELALRADFSGYIVGATPRDAACSSARVHIQNMLFEYPEDGLLYESSGDFEREYLKYKTFVDELNVGNRLASVNPETMDSVVIDLAGDVGLWLREDNPLLRYKSIYYVWAGGAIIYLLIVAVAYFGGRLTVSKGEPILNIIDVGLYLTLIEYSGGIDSPLVRILSITLLAALIDLTSLFSREDSGLEQMRIAVQMRGACKALSEFVPFILYAFALTTGLIWASLDAMVESDTSLYSYAGSVFGSLIEILIIGCFLFLVGYMLHLVLNKAMGGLESARFSTR